MVEPRIRDRTPNVIVAPEALVPNSITVQFFIYKNALPGQTEPLQRVRAFTKTFSIPHDLRSTHGMIAIIPIGRTVDKKEGIIIDDLTIAPHHGNLFIQYDFDSQKIVFYYQDLGEGTSINSHPFKKKTVPVPDKGILGFGYIRTDRPTSAYSLTFSYE